MLASSQFMSYHHFLVQNYLIRLKSNHHHGPNLNDPQYLLLRVDFSTFLCDFVLMQKHLPHTQQCPVIHHLGKGETQNHIFKVFTLDH